MQSSPVSPSAFTHRNAHPWACALVAAALLAGCGGGDGDATPPATPNPPPTPAPSPTLSQAQGIWQSAAGASTTVSAIVLPDGVLWAVLVNGAGASASTTTRVLKATLSAQGSGYSATGKSYTLGGGASAPGSVPVAASVLEKSALEVRVGTGAGAESLALAWQVRYDSPAQLADLAGNWSATVGPGVVSLTVDAQGRITGSRTTGCTYSGQLSLRTERKAVVDAQLQEDCAGARVQLSGVATAQAAFTTATGTVPAQLNMVLTTADEAQAVLLALQR